MSADWPFIELGELVNEITVGFVGSMMHEYVDDGVPFFRSKNISEYEIEWNDIRYISQDFHQRLKKSVLRPGDVVIVRTGKPGTACVIPDSIDEANCSDIVIVRVNNDKLSAHYLSYFMNSIASHQVSSHLVGAVQQHFNVGSAKKIKMPLPTRDEQEKIVKILKSLDDKRKLNRQINQILESMAQAIFKSWFVDFEPVKAKIAANEAGVDAEDVTCAAMRAISGKTDGELDQMQAGQPEDYVQLKNTAELFPAAMQDSELGGVPEGWGVVNLKELSKTISKGTTPSKKHIANAEGARSIGFIKVKDIADDGQINRTGLELIHESIHKSALKRSMLEENDLLFSIAGTIGRVSIVENDLHNSNTNQAVAFIRLNRQDNLLLVLEHLKSKRIQESAMASVVQGVQANVSLTSVGNFQIVVPKEPILAAWNEVALSLHTEKIGRQKQNRLLSQLRDTLLPKLLSGELEIHAANKAER